LSFTGLSTGIPVFDASNLTQNLLSALNSVRLSNDNYNSFSGDSYFSRLFWVKSARFFLVFSWFGFLLSLAPAFGRRGGILRA